MIRTFSPSVKMIDLIKEDPSLLLTITRFGFPLGFGDKTIVEVCNENKIDLNTFLAVVNFISSDYNSEVVNYDDISLPWVIVYLENAHAFFLDFKLPLIRKKIIKAVEDGQKETPFLHMILKFFDDYVAEVKKHMDHENKKVFPYVMKLVEGHKDPVYNIQVFEKNHENIDSKLTDLKNILIKYFPSEQPNFLLNEVLFDLSACEKDLDRHNQVEDLLFVPITEELEQKLETDRVINETAANSSAKSESLSEREIDVLKCVVKGMTNKEIANALFLSTHTVISHRRNITRKLEINSTAGLTIYAIVHQLVSLDDIKSVIE